jgi:hypothetical protein
MCVSVTPESGERAQKWVVVGVGQYLIPLSKVNQVWQLLSF